MDTENTYVSQNVGINKHDLPIYQYIIFSTVCLSIDICGSVANILNIICFVKQGFRDPVNVTLLGLSISDLCCLVPLIWASICFTPAMSDVDLQFDPISVQYLTGAWPHLTFNRVTAWMTALITLERCLCVTIPLQVKNIITSRGVSIISATIFIILITSIAPIYVVNQFGWVFFPEKNKTCVGLVFKENRETVEAFFFMFNVFIFSSAFIVIIVCTTILVFKLKTSTKWRSSEVALAKTAAVSSRNQKVSKMVVMLSTVFIACFLPVVIILIVMVSEPELSIYGKYINVAIVLTGLTFIVESINSSMNIFIYYHMSSKYRDTFRQLFCGEYPK